MKHITFWLVLILIAAGLLLLGRRVPTKKKAQKIVPASVSKIEGTDRMRLTLLPEAAKRLDIQTALVREKPIGPTQKFPGELISAGPDHNTAMVQVKLTENDLRRLRRGEPAFVLPLARDSKAPRIQALPVSPLIKLPPRTIYYEVNNADHGLVNRQLVVVELTLLDSGEVRKVIPYAAVLYDAKGNTWVYTNPEPLVFVRQSIQIDTIVGDDVFLGDGPPVGTAVVTVGGAELYGTEFGVGK
jgi:hypothetical protein